MRRNNIMIIHPEYNGGIVEDFEKAIGKSIASLSLNDNKIQTSLGYLPLVTYEYLTFTSNSVLLEGIKCQNCKEYVIMTSKAIFNRDIECCPSCNKNIFKRERKRKK